MKQQLYFSVTQKQLTNNIVLAIQLYKMSKYICPYIKNIKLRLIVDIMNNTMFGRTCALEPHVLCSHSKILCFA